MVKISLKHLVNFKTIVFLLFSYFSCFAEIMPWISGATLWGQGSVGVTCGKTNNEVYIQDDFTYKKKITFNEFSFMYSYFNNLIGARIRESDSTDFKEISPLIGRKEIFRFDFVTLIEYNEFEFRNNSYVNGDDYVRYNNVTTLYSKSNFVEEIKLKPFVANSFYFDCEDKVVEKDRVYCGVSYEIWKINYRVYFIPYFYGSKEGGWDDNNKFGASITLAF